MPRLEEPLIGGSESEEPLQIDCREDGEIHRDIRRPVRREESFIAHFVRSNGPPQVLILCLLIALSIGSTVGVIPAVMTDRYARLNHGFDSDQKCADFGKDDKPSECEDGSDDAQNAAALESLVSNLLTFTTSSLMGSISDEKGRKGLLVLGNFLALLGPMCLVLIQMIDSMSPTWYYVGTASTGLVSWTAVALATLSDVMPQKWRAPSFGLLLAGFGCGMAFSPILALAFSHLAVSVMALSLLLGGLIFTIFFLPETLPRDVSEEAIRARTVEENETHIGCIVRNLIRPAKELSILNRSRLFRLLSALAFFSGMTSSADRSLFLYYVEGRVGFDLHDVALMYGIYGVGGMLVQGALLKPLNDRIGERWVVVVAFMVGTVTHVLYGLAKSKATIFVGVALACFTGMAFPTISAIKSCNVDEKEQGRIQGALYSLSALASAVGPVTLRAVYRRTEHNPYPGAGTMFLVAAGLQVVAVFCGYALPKEQANSCKKHEEEILIETSEIDGPLV